MGLDISEEKKAAAAAAAQQVIDLSDCGLVLDALHVAEVVARDEASATAGVLRPAIEQFSLGKCESAEKIKAEIKRAQCTLECGGGSPEMKALQATARLGAFRSASAVDKGMALRRLVLTSAEERAAIAQKQINTERQKQKDKEQLKHKERKALPKPTKRAASELSYGSADSDDDYDDDSSGDEEHAKFIAQKKTREIQYT